MFLRYLRFQQMLVYYICSLVTSSTSSVRNEKQLSFLIINRKETQLNFVLRKYMTKTELIYMYMYANRGIMECCKFIWEC